MSHKPIVCAQCGNEIPFGEPYLKIGDNYLQAHYFETEELNRFCSQDCICEYLSVIEMPHDGSKSLSEIFFGIPNNPDEFDESQNDYEEE